MKNSQLKKIKIGKNSYFYGVNFNVGTNFSVGENTIIKTRNFSAGDYVSIGRNNNILVSRELNIGGCSSIGDANEIVGLNIQFGDYLFAGSNIVIGHGGKFSNNSTLKIGSGCMICSNTKLNINYPIAIGDNVGIGENVDIWTHGSYLAILDGFPFQFGPVEVGSNVWIPAKSTILPNVVIGDNVVLSANSVVTKSIPSGSFAAGMPARVIRENAYPKILAPDEKISLIVEILREYEELKTFKCIDFEIFFDSDKFLLYTQGVTFNLNTMSASAELDDYAEDLRDFLRRRGIKFFTGKPFRSLMPKEYEVFYGEK